MATNLLRRCYRAAVAFSLPSTSPGRTRSSGTGFLKRSWRCGWRCGWLRLAQRFDTDAVVANVGHSKQNPDPGAFIVIKPTGETFAANDRSSGIFDDEDEFILDESPGAVTPLGRIAL